MSQQVEIETPRRVELLSTRSTAPARTSAPGRRTVVPRNSRFAPPAERAAPRVRFFGFIGLLIGFAVIAVIPTALAGVYYGWFASDVYVSEAKFAVRGSTEKLPSSSAAASMMMSNVMSLNSNQDAYVVTNYIHSTPFIDKMERELGVRAMFTRDDIDPIARLAAHATPERFRQYWGRMVSASVDTLSGVVSLEVRTFAPEDALRLSKAIILASEELINDLSRRKRADAVRFANEEVDRAENRVRNSMQAIQAFRNQSGFLDPLKSAESTGKLLAGMRTERVELANELATAKRSLSDSAPSVQILAARLASLSDQIEKVERELTTSSTSDDERSASRALAQYEGLQLEKEFSEKFYAQAMLLGENARIEADRQQLYLVTFVEPSLAQMALHPRRIGNVMVVFACCVAMWSVVSLLVAAVRDHGA